LSKKSLPDAVEHFAGIVQNLTDLELDTEWAWGDYDSDGVRFAFFRIYEELRELATTLAAVRAANGPATTTAQRALAQYHGAYRDLEAALLGVTSEEAERAPAEGEWSLREVLSHIVRADTYFFALVRYALDGHRRGVWQPAAVPDEAWDGLVGMEESALKAITGGPIDGIRLYHARLHEQIMDQLAGIGDDELGKPSMYWEEEPMSVAFRLGRFDSHMRQHIVQIDKTLVGIGRAPNEARRLLRLIYAALAEVEGVTVGAGDVGVGLKGSAAVVISDRADEIAAVLA
jgi:hypothetical protein